ncbi:hypothetical protein LEN26_020703 [Aphanomyces euteiches]|nr:hypothetical protein LEN26_020703 [Aphanomyces euteiches]KAH9129131.1 hypothetical protein AeMF1_000786 [Aphanomyces euteiches]KAH9189697.1 hypothetical protein AeNC1_008331 [Aphanomyces euteiches]
MLGREVEIRALVTLLGGNEDPVQPFCTENAKMYPLVVVSGYNSTGKSSVVRLVLQKLHRNAVQFTAFVDCMTIYHRRQMFTDILRQIDPMTRVQANELTETFEIKPVADGYHNLSLLSFLECMSKIARDKNVVIALDNVDVLLTRGMSDLVRSFCRLSEELHLDIRLSFVLITRRIGPSLDKLLAPLFPAHVPFPLYTSAQITDIMVEQLKMWRRERPFRAWIKYLLSLVEHDSHDWVEFRSMVIQMLPLFDQHISDDDDNVTEEASKTAYKRLMQDTQSHVKQQRGLATTDESGSVDLPTRCLLLVLASYLASFNPQQSDLTYFTNAQRKKTRRKTTAKPKETVRQQLLGPKAFPLQRLLAIYHSLHDEYDPPNTFEHGREDHTLSRRDAFAQINMLVRMRLLQRISPLDELDEIKLRSLADFDFVERIAKQLEFPIENFLHS